MCTITTTGFGQILSEFFAQDEFCSSACISWSEDCVASIEEICKKLDGPSISPSEDSSESSRSLELSFESSELSAEASNSSSDGSSSESDEYPLSRLDLRARINSSKIFNHSMCNQCGKSKSGSARSE
jgi:hypothetical protein